MRLLVIEDERELAGLMCEALERAGMHSDCFGEIGAAEHVLQNVHYDAILLDLSLPDGRGETLLLNHRRNGGSAPVLIVTATDAVHSRIECLNLGADDYLVKPFDSGELVARVRALLRRAERSGSRSFSVSFPSTPSPATSPRRAHRFPCHAANSKSSST